MMILDSPSHPGTTDGSGKLRLVDLFDMEEIQQIQDSFAKQTGVASVITDVSGNPITRCSNFSTLCEHVIRKCPKGLANCIKSDAIIGRDNPGGPIVQRCLSGGLLDAGTSIRLDGNHIANWLIGQVCDESMDIDKMMAYAEEIGADKEAYRAALEKLPRMSLSQFTRISETLFLVATQLSKLASKNRHQAVLIAEKKKAEQERELLLKDLAAKNRELEYVIYAASHDLRSPLLNIQGFSRYLEQDCTRLAEILKEIDLPAELAGKVNTIIQDQVPKSVRFISSGVVKMDTLIGGLLKISRLGQVELKREILDMNQLVSQTLSSIDFQLREAGASAKAGVLPPCEGDALLISQVFSNLIDNALKYRNPEHPLRIEITGSMEGESLVYCVADNGKGIAKEDHDRIWELFRRLDPASSTQGEGLGLTLVRRIVERHHGTIRVESSLGNGCSFFVSLPKSNFPLTRESREA